MEHGPGEWTCFCNIQVILPKLLLETQEEGPALPLKSCPSIPLLKHFEVIRSLSLFRLSPNEFVFCNHQNLMGVVQCVCVS